MMPNSKREVNIPSLLWLSPTVHSIVKDDQDRTMKYIQQYYKLIDEYNWKGHVIKLLNVAGIEESVKETETSFSYAVTHSDLIPSVYEGGLKIWECSWDLMNYLNENDFQFTNKRVLDLGCGSGILGIAAALRGASVIFQDYNVDVLKCVTIPNVLLNQNSILHALSTEGERTTFTLLDVNKRFKFYSGSWNQFGDVLTENESKIDIILTSETIYNLKTYSSLLDVFNKCLKDEGLVILAAKTHYFGVGGNCYDFIKLVKEENVFGVESFTCNNEGVKREIIILKRSLRAN